MLHAREGDGRFGPSRGCRTPLPDTGSRSCPQPAHRCSTRPRGRATCGRSSSRAPRSSVRCHRLRSRARSGRAELNEVKALGRATGSTRTDEQTYIAKWWQSAPVFSWNEVARQLITRTDLDAADSARLLALQNMSGADAAINCWNDKYHFDFWRPWNAVPRAARTTTPRRWPTRPGRRSSPRRTRSGPRATTASTREHHGAADVLRRRPRGWALPDHQHLREPRRPAVRTFDTFTQPLTELIEARIWAGLHYRSADVAGQTLGRNVANYGAANYFQPVGN